MGLAQGKLMATEIQQFVSKTWEYLISAAVEEMGDKISPAAQAMIIEKGFDPLKFRCY